MQYGPVTVPRGHYFMMGDNRDNSQDSRYWGFLPQEYVKGKALFVYFSFGEETGLSGSSAASGGTESSTRFIDKTIIKLADRRLASS